MEDVIDFVVWITKNDRKKVQELYLSYLNEKIEENKLLAQYKTATQILITKMMRIYMMP